MVSVLDITTSVVPSAHPLGWKNTKCKQINKTQQQTTTNSNTFSLLTATITFGNDPSTLFVELVFSYFHIYFYSVAWKTKFVINIIVPKQPLFTWALFLKHWFRSHSLLPQKPFVFKWKHILMTPVISKLGEQVQRLQAKLLIASFLVMKLLCKELLCFFSLILNKSKIAAHQVSNLADGCYCII